MAQEYTVEQLNHGRKVYDFMRWDYWAFGISGLLLIAATSATLRSLWRARRDCLR